MTEISSEEIKKNINLDQLSAIQLDLTIEVGQKMMTLKEMMELKEGDVIALNKLCNDPFDIKVNGKKIAEGEVVQHENQFYVKVSHILKAAE